jgi:glycosyltransferase involved in cell wall biosynthesis
LNSSPRIAIFSPNKDAYSESFIQRHKNLLNGKIFYFYGGYLPHFYEPIGNILGNDWFRSLLINFGRSFLGRNQYDKDFFLKKLLKKLKVNVIFAEYGQTAVHSLKICKELRLPLIVHFHGFDAFKKQVLNEYAVGYKNVFDYADAIICVSEPMREQLISLCCPKNKIHKIRCCPDESFYKLKPDYNSKKFVSVGRFVDKKAPYYLLLAFSKLLKHCPSSTLTIIGEGPLLEVTKNIASYLGIDEKIFLPGILDRQKIQDEFKHSSCYIQHSITVSDGDQEGSPVAVLEALAAGLPVISTKHAGIPEVIEHDENGFLVDEHDVEGMSFYMQKIAKDFKIAQKIGSNAKKYAKDNFYSNPDIRDLNNLIKEAL